jgi:hypothetical protein
LEIEELTKRIDGVKKSIEDAFDKGSIDFDQIASELDLIGSDLQAIGISETAKSKLAKNQSEHKRVITTGDYR